MITLQVPSSSLSNRNVCNSCCCEQICIKYMSSETLLLDFGPWAAPVAERGLFKTKIDIVRLSDNYDSIDKVIRANYVWKEDDVVDLLGVLEHNDFKRCKIDYLYDIESKNIVSDLGILTDLKTPEWFYNKVSSQNEVEYEAIYVDRVDCEPYALPEELARVWYKVLPNSFFVQFHVKLTPFANVGDIIRLNIKQEAKDCDCHIYTKDYCVDITVVKC